MNATTYRSPVALPPSPLATVAEISRRVGRSPVFVRSEFVDLKMQPAATLISGGRYFQLFDLNKAIDTLSRAHPVLSTEGGAR